MSDSNLVEFLYYPTIATAIGGVVVYITEVYRKRNGIKAALEVEIKKLITKSEMNSEYLSKESHYWLKENEIIEKSPTVFRDSPQLFMSFMPDIYVLGEKTVRKVIAFYDYHEFCENLRISLFSRVNEYKLSRKPLESNDVEIIKARIERLQDAYEELFGDYTSKMTLKNPKLKLKSLKLMYNIPSDDNLLLLLGEQAGSSSQRNIMKTE